MTSSPTTARKASNSSNSSSAVPSTASGVTGSSLVYDSTQSDSWDVGDLGVVHVANDFVLPVWLQKKYPNLDVFNRHRYDSIIFRCGGHLIRDKKVTARCDAILLDDHYLDHTATAHSTANSAVPMQQLVGYQLSCFPDLPSKRYSLPLSVPTLAAMM